VKGANEEGRKELREKMRKEWREKKEKFEKDYNYRET